MAKGFGNLMKQAQQLQAKMAGVQEEMGQKKVEASVGGGMVVAIVNGNLQLLEIKIAPEAVEDVEMLQDMVLTAVNKAQQDAQEMMKQAVSSLTGGMNIPGLF